MKKSILLVKAALFSEDTLLLMEGESVVQIGEDRFEVIKGRNVGMEVNLSQIEQFLHLKFTDEYFDMD